MNSTMGLLSHSVSRVGENGWPEILVRPQGRSRPRRLKHLVLRVHGLLAAANRSATLISSGSPPPSPPAIIESVKKPTFGRYVVGGTRISGTTPWIP